MDDRIGLLPGWCRPAERLGHVPGLYDGGASDIQVAGRWRVPTYYQEGEFAFTREQVPKDVVGF